MQLALFNESAPPVRNARYEYLIIISPDNAVKKYAWECNRKVKEILENEGRQEPMVAHITLVHNISSIEIDELFITAVNNVAAELHSFPVYIKGFDFFERPNHNVLFISITNEAEVKAVHDKLYAQLEYESLGFKPHITVKRHIQREKFPLVWNYFEQLEYESQFVCDRILILKRMVQPHKKENYKPLHEALLLK